MTDTASITSIPLSKLTAWDGNVRKTAGADTADQVLGSLSRPLSDADLEAKFRGLTEGILSPRQIDELISLCWFVTSLGDSSAIARASVA